MGLNTWVSVVVIIGVALTAAAAIGGSFRTGRAGTAITNYRTVAESWEAKAQVAESEKQAMATQVADLTARVEVLQSLVTGKARVEVLTEQVAALSQKLDDRAVKMDARVGEVLALIGANRSELRALSSVLLPGRSDRGD